MFHDNRATVGAGTGGDGIVALDSARGVPHWTLGGLSASGLMMGVRSLIVVGYSGPGEGGTPVPMVFALGH